MKTFMKYLFCFFMVCAVGMMAQAADKSVNRKMGYFDNTRTVLLLLQCMLRHNCLYHCSVAKESVLSVFYRVSS